MQYSTVQHSTVQYNTVQYSTVQYTTAQIQYITNTMQCNTTQYSTVLYNTIQYLSFLSFSFPFLSSFPFHSCSFLFRFLPFPIRFEIGSNFRFWVPLAASGISFSFLQSLHYSQVDLAISKLIACLG